VVLEALPYIYVGSQRLAQSRLLTLVPLCLLVLNTVIFVYNVSQNSLLSLYLQENQPMDGVSLLEKRIEHSPVFIPQRQIDDEYEDENQFEGIDQERVGEFGMMQQVEWARANAKFQTSIGTIKHLQPGVLLVANPGVESEWEHSVILLVSHGGQKPSTGYIVNSPLPKEEGDKARLMLREFQQGHEFSQRNKRLRNAIMSTDKLWLGKGGPVRSEEESWTHIHDCIKWVEDENLIAPGVGVGGDVLEILSDDSCFIKLMYGSSRWKPGQLDHEVSQGLWKIVPASSSLVFNKINDRHSFWLDLIS